MVGRILRAAPARGTRHWQAWELKVAWVGVEKIATEGKNLIFKRMLSPMMKGQMRYLKANIRSYWRGVNEGFSAPAHSKFRLTDS